MGNKPTPLEKDIQKGILQYLDVKRIFAWRNNTGGGYQSNPSGKSYFVRFSVKGAPDIIGIMPNGKFLAIEVKRPGQLPSEDQLWFLKEVASKGGVAIVASSIDEVETVFKEHGY